MDWSQTSLQPAFLTGIFWGYFRTPEEKLDWPAIRKSLALCADYFGLLDTILADHPFLLGDRPPQSRSLLARLRLRLFGSPPKVTRVKRAIIMAMAVARIKTRRPRYSM